MDAIRRDIEDDVRDRLASAAAVVLLGPRQVGKTTLARKVGQDHGATTLYLDLERPSDLRRLDDVDGYLRAQPGRLVILDEIHRVPELFANLRGVIDDRRAAGDRFGHFLLLGSAAIDLMRQASESLAGRIAYLDVAPIGLSEALPSGISTQTLWVRGGFPDSLLAPSDRASAAWRRDFIRSYLERDVPMFAPRMPAETVGRLWRMLAYQQGSLLNQARLASSLGVSAVTVGGYIDLLSDLRLVRRLPPWSGNLNKRLVRSPKVYVRDSGIVHALLELRHWDDIVGHPIAGPSFEGMAIESLVQCAGDHRAAYFYRTQDGAEIDLLFSRGGAPEIAIEIKLSTAPVVPKGFTIACDDLGITQRYLVHTGTEAFPMRHGVRAVPLPEMVRILRADGRGSVGFHPPAWPR
jgi:predicted AAA+ superfamily ATPase